MTASRLWPVRMQRVALVARDEDLPAVLDVVGAAGAVELEPLRTADRSPDTAAAMAAGAAGRDGCAALPGWCPANTRVALAARIAPLGGALVPLPNPPGADPPTMLAPAGPARRAFAPLVRTYGTVPYDDLDPTLPAGIAYVVMFGMMFADVGHGLLLLTAALVLRLRPPRRLARLRPVWPFVAGAGLASAGFGALLGECFGPTGLVPAFWLEPLADPVRLLVTGVVLGGVLLAGAYAVGVINRWREGGPAAALYAPSGIAGSGVFAGAAVAATGWYLRSLPLAVAGILLAAAGLGLAATGLRAAAGAGGAALAQTLVQLFDLVIRIGANVVSFARLAAFGLTHAALGAVVWAGTAAAWHQGGDWVPVAVVLFVVGNAVTFGLEVLVAGVQALRLEYYELFSRVFEATGRPFRPWRIAAPAKQEVPT
ncbi:V-type ATPase 116kDa subunit family protein [Dactylosporangium sp. NPDC049140]|uniref:V-type ATPase 116kDa subunit family protein n=1 Tax=Dactylosporangium sp. NPDC049140 TaxID=3155647 RepID=UPI0033D1E455